MARSGPGGGPAGDLYVELYVANHEVFRREGDDLEVVVKIPMTAAALGTEVLVATLGGRPARLRPGGPRRAGRRCPSGTQSGTRIGLDGRGVPRLRGSGRGQLGVTLLVQTPTRIDDEQRELLRQLAELREETRPEVHRAEDRPRRLRPAPGRLRRSVTAVSADAGFERIRSKPSLSLRNFVGSVPVWEAQCGGPRLIAG